MRNERHQDKERVRIEFSRKTLKEASNFASTNGETLSVYIERLVQDDLGKSTAWNVAACTSSNNRLSHWAGGIHNPVGDS